MEAAATGASLRASLPRGVGSRSAKEALEAGQALAAVAAHRAGRTHYAVSGTLMEAVKLKVGGNTCKSQSEKG
jgi:hypothetical protein